MITCMELVVGMIKSASRQDALNQCAKFLSTHKYLVELGVQFKIDGSVYATVLDTCEDHGFWVLFEVHDGLTGVGLA